MRCTVPLITLLFVLGACRESSRDERPVVLLGSPRAGEKVCASASAAPWRSRGKHEGWGITLQGYAGLRFGGEFLTEGPRDRGLALSPALSIGIQAHYGGSAARFVFYAQLLDVGNVVSVRLTDEDNSSTAVDVDTIPDITWAQLFAPGFYVGPSFGATPVDLLFGFNYVPALRTANDARVGAFQVGLMLVVDVSIMRLR